MIARKQLTALFLVPALIAADQASKWAVMEKILRPASGAEGQTAAGQGFWSWVFSPPAPLPFTRVEALPVFDWVMVWNRGVSFGMFQNESAFGPALMIAIALAIVAFFSVWLFRARRWFLVVPIAAVMGGAVGNVIDRVRFGAVVDFLDFHLAGYHWPAFNIADAAITLGIAAIVIDGVFFGPEKQGENAHENGI